MADIPKIRFKGFTEPWEQRKFQDVVEVAYQGINTTADKVEYVNKGVPILQGKHITSGKIDYKDVRYLDKEKYEPIYYPKYVPKANDILLANIGTIGPSVVMEHGVELLIAWNIMLIRLNEKADVKFVKVFLDKLNNSNFYESIMRGNATKFINKEGIMNIEIPYPSVCEQQKIGAYFANLDHLITLHQRKYFIIYNKLITWEQRKLGEICSRVQGNDGRMELPTLTISAANGWMKQEDRFSGNIAGKEQKNYTLLHKGELSYNHGNSKLAKYGTVFSLQTYEEALVPRVYHSFKVEIGSADFIEYYFATKMPDRELRKLISSGARMDGLLNIGYDDFMGIKMMFPSVLEQDKIAEYFRAFDHLIALHRRAL